MRQCSIGADNELAYNSQVSDYISLLKPRILLLVVFTACAGIVMAPGSIHPFLCFISLLCVTLGSGAAGALNMWYDHDIDAMMERTKKRAIPTGRVSKDNALELGIMLSLFSVATMAWVVNYISAILLAFAIFFYAVVYTILLKRNTHHNVVIGGAAGAFPPVIGWTSVTNSISIEPLILFLIIFMWTPPHFWALSLLRSEEYKRVRVPMLPVVKGDASTRKSILLYTTLLVLTSFLPCFVNMNGFVYNIVAIVLGVMFLFYSYNVYLKRVHPYKLFKFSVLYLFLLFISMIFDKIYVF